MLLSRKLTNVREAALKLTGILIRIDLYASINTSYTPTQVSGRHAYCPCIVRMLHPQSPLRTRARVRVGSIVTWYLNLDRRYPENTARESGLEGGRTELRLGSGYRHGEG